MLNRITLIGIVKYDLSELYEPDGAIMARIHVIVPPPPDAPRSDASRADMGYPESPDRNNDFLVICRGSALVRKCVESLHKGDLVYIEGRLVLTTFRVGDYFWQLHEILASEVIPLHATSQ